MKQKDILLLIISGFTLVIFWIIFNIYHNSVTSTISDSTTVQIFPINPNFDMQTIESLKQRTQISPLYSNSATQSAQPATTFIPVPTPVSTQSAATSGGTLQ